MTEDPRESVLDQLRRAGGLRPGVAGEVARATGVPEAEVHGLGSFYPLLAHPEHRVGVCTGLSCRLAGADEVLAAARRVGLPCREASCLAACDVAPAVLFERQIRPRISVDDIVRTDRDWTGQADADGGTGEPWRGVVGPERTRPESLALDLLGPDDSSGSAFARAKELGPDGLIDQIEASGLQGRGGAGFPAHIKWRALRNTPLDAKPTRYVVLNGDESEPGTFKDRELLLRRPHAVLEGLAIAAFASGAREVTLYLRGEFEFLWQGVERAIADAAETDRFDGLRFHLHAGHGAYICGEETALLEALEGKRGMPRQKPPLPVVFGLRGQPTLIHNVETIACVPAIVNRGADWFRALGRKEAGTKLYCLSGHVARPGTYELPLGTTLDELVDVAGGYTGELKAFSPGGASSGFLPASKRDLPLDFSSLAAVGSMLGTGGVVVLDQGVDMRWAALEQLRFFERESCGQCAPCRIGTRYLREAVECTEERASAPSLKHVADVAWQMNEGSICGLGQTAPLPLTSALEYFPEDFSS